MLHNSYFLESARNSPVFTHDPVEYIFTMAEKSPTQFGESAVLNTDLVWVLNDGEERVLNEDELYKVGYGLERPDDAINDLPVMRPTELHFIDTVSEGALTHDGMFSTTSDIVNLDSIFAPGKSSYFAKEVFAFLDEYRRAYKLDIEQLKDILPRKIKQIITAYEIARGRQKKGASFNHD